MVDLSLSEAELAAERQRITRFIREQVDEAGANGAVLGLSGGIDSSLTAALTVEAVGADAVTGLSLPAAVSSDRHRNDAELVADQLGLDLTVIEIEPLVSPLVEAVPHSSIGERARGNASARLRAVLNYLIANEEGRLVIGTGNRSEALVGYFTKYGDGAVDCHPIGGLYKCQVRQLARALDIPERIIEKPPTAELWAGQADEDELGLEYDQLDRILALNVDGPLSVAATARELDCSPELVERVRGLVSGAEHKRQMPPAPDA